MQADGRTTEPVNEAGQGGGTLSSGGGGGGKHAGDGSGGGERTCGDDVCTVDGLDAKRWGDATAVSMGGRGVQGWNGDGWGLLKKGGDGGGAVGGDACGEGQQTVALTSDTLNGQKT